MSESVIVNRENLSISALAHCTALFKYQDLARLPVCPSGAQQGEVHFRETSEAGPV